MGNRYQQTSLTRQLALVNKLFTWKCQSDQNVDKWVQEWCDVLKEFLNLQEGAVNDTIVLLEISSSAGPIIKNTNVAIMAMAARRKMYRIP
ncbi:hypothetical protein V1524DRAFT_463205 [Lipomyces starkeyi]